MVFGFSNPFAFSRPRTAATRQDQGDENAPPQVRTTGDAWYDQPGMFSFLPPPPTRDGAAPGVHFSPNLAQGRARQTESEVPRPATALPDHRIGTAESSVNPDLPPRGASRRGKHQGSDGGFVQGGVQSGASIRRRKRQVIPTHVITDQINEIRNSVREEDFESPIAPPAPSVFSEEGGWSGTTMKQSNDGRAWSSTDVTSTLAATEMQTFGLKKSMHPFDPFDPPRGVTATTIEINYSDEPDEDSPFPEVRASVSNFDDPDMPVATFRSVLLGLLFTFFLGSANAFFYLRNPSPLLFPNIAIMLAYPIGKSMAWTMPMNSWRTPKWLRQLGFPTQYSLNPGPFNIKEHSLILIMVNCGMGAPFGINYSVVAEVYYDRKPSALFDIVYWLSTQMIGYGLAGFARRFLVWPAGIIWPQNLSWCTLMNTLHAEDDEDGGKREISRNRLMIYVMAGSFFWYFLPGFLFQALSYFSFICWMAPNNVRVNHLFGVTTGLGMSIITFDWSQIAYLGSPLVVPWWAIVNISIGFVFVFWFLAPILYYSNAGNMAYLPMMDLGLYDRFGAPYNISNVVDLSKMTFNEAAYHEYSPIYLTIGYTIVYGTTFAVAMALISHTVLYHGKDMWRQVKNPHNPIDQDVHMRLMKQYDEIPNWWFASFFIFMTLLSIFAVTAWGTILPVWALLFAIFIGAVYVIPSTYVFALSTQQITINSISQLIASYCLPGNAVGIMIFKTYAGATQTTAMQSIQGFKIGHYMKIPPRTNFIMQCLATSVGALAQLGVKDIVMSSPDACLPTNTNHLTCPQAKAMFSSSIIWGLMGPNRVFGTGTTFGPILWAMFIGFLLPILFWWAGRRWPDRGLSYISIPVLLAGLTFAPPATGINYSSWLFVGFVFQHWGRKHFFRLWSKYNFVLSGALDIGTAISILFIFLTLQLPKDGTIAVDWWGNNVFMNTMDYLGGTWKTAPETGFGPTTWK
ncbi:OPT-domain-containing protein [Meredithblackwellia eburnea MCA 4105]